MNVTVVRADKLKDKENGFAVWKVTAREDDGTTIEAERFSKWPPMEGEKGTIEQSQYGPKFVPAGGGGGGKKGSSDPSIEAQVALKAAIEWALAHDGNTENVVALTKTFAQAIREAKA